MAYRRSLYVALPWAVVVLPTWLLVGRGVVATESGWDFLVYLIIAPVLAVTIGAVSFVTWARYSVRSTRAVSTLDAVVISAWFASILAYGVVPGETAANVLATLGVLLAIAAFWSAAIQWFREARARVRDTMSLFQLPSDDRATGDGRSGYDARRDDGPIIRIDPPDGR